MNKFETLDGAQYSVDDSIFELERESFYRYVNIRINMIMLKYAKEGKTKEEVRDLVDTEINTFLQAVGEDRFAEFQIEQDPDFPEKNIINFRLVRLQVV